MAQDLVVQQQQLLAQFQGQDSEIEGLGESERRGPKLLRIVHPASIRKGDPAKPGQFRLGSHLADDAKVVILKSHRFRELQEGEGRNKVTTCQSPDAERPVMNGRQKAEWCRLCQWGAWDEGPTGEKKPPLCNTRRAFLGVWPEAGEAFWFTGSRGYRNFKVAEQFLTDLKTWSRTLPEAQRIRALCEVRVTLTTKEERNGGVTYYTPEFACEPLPAEERAFYRAIYERVKELAYLPWVDEVGGEEPEKVAPVANGVDDTQAPF